MVASEIWWAKPVELVVQVVLNRIPEPSTVVVMDNLVENSLWIVF